MSASPELKSVIRGVSLESVITKKVGANESTIWKIQTVNGPEVTTFLAGLGNRAEALHGQGTIVDMEVTVSQNGKFTNYRLEKIQPSADQSNATSPIKQAAAGAQAAQPQEVSFDTFAKQSTAERSSIHRQKAAAVAADLLGPTDGPADFWANVEGLYSFFETGAIPGGEVTAAPTASRETITVGNALPTFTGSEPEPTTDDDIPF